MTEFSSNHLTPVEIIHQLEATASKKEKEQIVRNAWDAGCVEFFEGAQLCYDKLISFGTATLPMAGVNHDTLDVPWGTFLGLTQGLRTRQIAGTSTDGKRVLQEFANACPPLRWNYWYRRILLKDLSCGITEGTINRVLKTCGAAAKPYMVPVFGVQRAESGDGTNKKLLKGKMFIDLKCDGARLATFLERENPEVLQYTRSGKPNTNFNKITQALAQIRPFLTGDIVLDGEIMSDSFNNLMTMVNRKSFVDTSDAFLAVFDVVGLKEFKAGYDPTPQNVRHENLMKLQLLFDEYCDGKVIVLEKKEVDFDTPEGWAILEEMKAMAAEVVDEETGRTRFEGVMAKKLDGVYEGKKCKHWLKIKPWIEVDLTVVGYTKGDVNGKRAGKIGGFLCEGLDEDTGWFITTECGGGLTDEMIDDLTAHPENGLGQIITIRAKEITTNRDGSHSLREPRFIKFRSIDGTPGEKD
jgi:DNA ligase-1